MERVGTELRYEYDSEAANTSGSDSTHADLLPVLGFGNNKPPTRPNRQAVARAEDFQTTVFDPPVPVPGSGNKAPTTSQAAARAEDFLTTVFDPPLPVPGSGNKAPPTTSQAAAQAEDFLTTVFDPPVPIPGPREPQSSSFNTDVFARPPIRLRGSGPPERDSRASVVAENPHRPLLYGNRLSAVGITMGSSDNQSNWPPIDAYNPQAHRTIVNHPTQPPPVANSPLSSSAPETPVLRQQRLLCLLALDLLFRAIGTMTLLVCTVTLVTNSYTDASTGQSYSYKGSATTLYLLSATIIGMAYELYQCIIVGTQLALGRSVLPSAASRYIPYVCDQVVMVLLSTAGAATAALLRDLQVLEECDANSSSAAYCRQIIASVAIVFVGFGFVAASSIISSSNFFANKT